MSFFNKKMNRNWLCEWKEERNKVFPTPSNIIRKN